jgi:hypothetical protein
MRSIDSSTPEQVRADEVYQRFFDDLYHTGTPADIFEPAVSPRPRPRKALAQSSRPSAVRDR